MKQLTTVILMFLTIQVCTGQSEKVQDYKKLYRTADSINRQGKDFIVDDNLIKKLNKFDKTPPLNYFGEAIRLFDANKFTEASVVYYIGFIRHKYCLGADPNYAPNEDWIVAESMQSTYGKKIVLFLKTNIDRYISVIDSATDYCQKNDYSYLPKVKNLEKYNSSIDGLIKLKYDYIKFKDLYTKQWNDERTALLSESK